MTSRQRERIRYLHRDGDPYPVLLRRGMLDDVGARAARMVPGGRVAVVTQARVFRLHGERLKRSLERAGVRVVVLTMPEGDERKNLETVSRLYDDLVAREFSRDDALFAFGGGTVGDTAGFVAATYLRGLPYAQVPTTLLAQIDSSIGGKVGVNHPKGKNLIGAIYRPRAVWIDPDLVGSLPRRQLRSGLFELVKYGLLGSRPVLRHFEAGGSFWEGKTLVEAIAAAVRAKLDVVREDETETGRRRVLNLGHTIGHGLEAAGDYRVLTHGEAVGWGMLGALRLAVKLGRLDARKAARLEGVVRRVGPLPSLARLSRRRTLDAVGKDKKRGRGGLRFVLPVDIGRVEIVEGLPLDEVAWALASLGVEAQQ